MDAKQLLADAAWLRRLASSLAGEADADDVVQESWIAAWRKQPDEGRPLRPWLSRVARDLAAMRRRSERRRLAREAAIEPDRESQTPDAMLEQVRLHRLLADLVLGLAEPYRSTIVARFFEGASSAEIARQLNIPDATVRARLREGLARLRAGLDNETGDRKAWAAVFLRGGINMAKPIKLLAIVVAIAIALLVAGIVLVLVHQPARDRSVIATTTAHGNHHGRPEPALSAMVLLAAPGRHIAGRVTADGRPVVHARVRLVGAASSERVTDDAGRFDFGTMPTASYSLGAITSDRLAEIKHIDTRDASLYADDLELALRPCEAALFGRVTDPSGSPIAGAQVLNQDIIGVETDEQGRYELCVPRVALETEELRTTVRAAGYAAQEVVTATQGHHAYDFVLVPEVALHGRLVDESGEPVANALVTVTTPQSPRAVPHRGLASVASATATSDSTGTFLVHGIDRGHHHLVARADGLVAKLDDASNAITITMKPSAIVHGRLMAGPAPVGGAVVTIEEVAATTAADGSFEIEDIAPGEPEPRVAPYRPRASTITLHAGTNDVVIDVEPFVTVRGTIRHHGAGVPNARLMVMDGDNYHACYSDASGHYELPGMSAGHYKGGADTDTAFADLDWTIEARDLDQDIELAEEGRIAGVVVDTASTPVANVVVRFENTAGGSSFDRGRCTTDSNGAFACGHMAGGTYKARVFFTESGQPELHLDHPSIDLSGGKARVDGLRLIVDARRRDIRGIVRDRAGVAIARAHVVASTGHEGNTAPLANVFTDEHGAFAFTGVAPGTYTLEADTRQATGAVTVEAGTVATVIVGGCEPSQAANPATRPAQRVVWDDRVELIGWDAPSSVHIGEPVTMTLYFKSLRTIDLPFDVFVHVAGEHRWINADHTPQDGRCSTTGWRPGDIIVDRFSFRTASDANGAPNPPGIYSIDIGLFRDQAGGWQNMPTATPGAIATVRLE